MQTAQRHGRLRLFLLLAAGLAAGVLVLVSCLSLLRARDLQGQLNGLHTASALREQLRGGLAHGQEPGLRRLVQDLVERGDLGLRYLAVADAAGVVLAVAGRYESLDLPLPAASAASLRRWLYGLGSSFGSGAILEGDRLLGSFNYAISDVDVARVRDAAVDQLHLASLIGLLVSLPLAGGLLWAARREFAPRPTLPAEFAQRLAPRAEPQAADARAEMLEQFRQRTGSTLDQFGFGILLTDREGRVRFLNRAAEELTGWGLADARSRPVYSVVHVADEAGETLLPAAELALREEREVPPQYARLRPRQGGERSIEMMAALLKGTDGMPDGAAMLFRDVSQRQQQLEDLRRQSRLSQGVIDHLDEGLLMTDPAGVVRFANARALRMFGYGRDELDGFTVTKLMPVPFLNTPSVKLMDYVGLKNPRQAPRVVGWRKDATTFPVELQVQPMSVGGDSGLIVIVRDISERLRGENLATRLGRLLDSAVEEIYIFDAQSTYFLEVNRGARRNLGYRPDQLARLTPLGISSGLDPEAFQGYLTALRGGDKEQLSYRCRHRRADGSEYPVEVRLNFSRDEEPPVFMAIATDISERLVAEEKLKHLAHHDPLTGLPNRGVLHDRLQLAMLAAGRSSRQVAVFFIDLDRFKQINDTHGHETGDLVLRSVADRLRAAVRSADTVARMGGDEFVVVAPEVRGSADASRIAQKLLDAFRPRLDIPGHDLKVTPSIGVALFPEDDTDADGLLRHADSAMYEAKQAGRNCFRLFDADPDPQRRRKLDLERGIHAAVALNEFHMLLEPVFDARDRVVAGLIGFWWEHSTYGAVPADESLRAATRAGLLADLELWVLSRACMHFRFAAAKGLAPVPIITSISGWQLRDPDFAGHLIGILERFQVPPRVLVLALTEDGYAEARSMPPERIRLLAARGVRFALRDFAGDFAALNRETSLPVEMVLLNGAISASAGEAGLARLRRIIETAAALDKPVIATAVADAATKAQLNSAGCTLVSGPLFGRPKTTREAAAWLALQDSAPL